MRPNAILLINEGVEIHRLKLWGSPVTPLWSGAFGLSSGKDRRRLYAGIPADTHVLVTHGPPLGILDFRPGSGVHAGCKELANPITRIRPKLHVFGHVHGAHGILETEDTTYECGTPG